MASSYYFWKGEHVLLGGNSSKFRASEEKVDDLNRVVKKNLARLERFYEEDSNLSVKKAGSNITNTAKEYSPTCVFLDNYLVIINKYKIILIVFHMQLKSLTQKFPESSILSIPSKDESLSSEIILFDLKSRKSLPNERVDMDIVFVTKNSNGIFSIYLNSVEKRKDQSQNVYGVAFYDENSILIMFAQTLELHTLELSCLYRFNIRSNAKMFPPLTFADMPTILRVFPVNRVFFAYVHMSQREQTELKSKEIRYLVVLEEYQCENMENMSSSGIKEIKQKEPNITFKNRIIIDESDCPQLIKDIKDMTHYVNNFHKDNKPPLDLYIVLESQIINVKEKGSGLESFLAVECSLKPPQYPEQEKINVQPIAEPKKPGTIGTKPNDNTLFINPANVQKKSRKQVVSNNILLLKMNMGEESDQESCGYKWRFNSEQNPAQTWNIYAMHMDYQQNTFQDPSTASMYAIKPDKNPDAVCKLKTSLKDILFLPNSDDKYSSRNISKAPDSKIDGYSSRTVIPNQQKIIYCFQLGDFLMLVHYDQLSPTSIYISSYKNDSKTKLRKLIEPNPKDKANEKMSERNPSESNLKANKEKPSEMISQRKMELLMRYYDIPSGILGDGINLFKSIWEKCKAGSDRPSHSTTDLEQRRWMNYLHYLYSVDDVAYIHSQMRLCIKKMDKVDMKTLRTYYENIKRISAAAINKKCLENKARKEGGSHDSSPSKQDEAGSRDIKLSEYLKSIFYLKKLEELDIDGTIDHSQFQRWEKRRAYQYFDANWGNQKRILGFINRHYNYFITNYESILRMIIENKINITGSKTITDNITNLLRLLPRYPQENELKMVYEEQREENKDNNSHRFCPIQKLLYFMGVNRKNPEIIEEDLKVIFPDLPDDEIEKSKKYLQENYMRSNDLLFMTHKEIKAIEDNLVENKQAIYILLELIIDKVDKLDRAEEHDPQHTLHPSFTHTAINTSKAESEQDSQKQRTMDSILKTLKKERHIDNNDYFHLMIGLRMHELGKKEEIKGLPRVSEFLQKSDIWKLKYLLLERLGDGLSEQEISKNIHMFKRINSIWDEAWKAICQPGDKYFRHVLSSEDSLYNIQLENFNNKEEIHNLIIESVFKRYFLDDESEENPNHTVKQIEIHSKHQGKVEVPKQLPVQKKELPIQKTEQRMKLSHMRQSVRPGRVPNVQKKPVEDTNENVEVRLLDDNSLESFGDAPVQEEPAVQSNKDIKIKRLILVMDLIAQLSPEENQSLKLLVEFLMESVFQKIPIIEENKIYFKRIIERLKNYNRTLRDRSELSVHPEQIGHESMSRHVYLNEESLESREQVLDLVEKYYDIFLEFNLNFTVNSLRGYSDNFIEDLWLEEISKIQTEAMREGFARKAERIEKQIFQKQLEFKMKGNFVDLYNIILFQKKFLEIFKGKLSHYDTISLIKKMYEVTLEQAFQQEIPLEKLEELCEVELSVKPVRDMTDEIGIDLNSQKLLQSHIHEWISKAKEEIKTETNPAKKNHAFRFIQKCLNIRPKDESIRKELMFDELYIKIQQNILKLQSQEFSVEDVPHIKQDCFQICLANNEETKKLALIYQQCMAKYIHKQIDDAFTRELDISYILHLNQNFSKSYFTNNEAVEDMPYYYDYLILKLVMSSVSAYNELEPKHNQNQKGKIPADILNYLLGEFQTIDLKNIKDIQKHQQLFTRKTGRPVDINPEFNRVQLNDSDIQIFSYFPQYVSDVKYFMLGKMLQMETRKGKEQMKEPDCADMPYERTFRTNMIFIVRYWKALNYDLNKIMLLIKITLDNPSRYQFNKRKDIEEVCFMLANLLEYETNQYVYHIRSEEELETLYNSKKKELDTKREGYQQLDPKEKKKREGNSKILAVLGEFLEKLRELKKNQAMSYCTKRKQAPKKKQEEQSMIPVSKTKEDSKQGPQKNIPNLALRPSSEATLETQLEQYFYKDIGRFIETVEKKIVSGEQSIKYNGNEFNLANFRKFVTCIKFDRNLSGLFDYNRFFFSKERLDDDKIFQNHLKRNIQGKLTDQNYLQIGKALRYGLGNLMHIQIGVTKLYLTQLCEENTDTSTQEVFKEFKQKLKRVFDMMDARMITQSFKEFDAILNANANPNIVGFLSEYLMKRGWKCEKQVWTEEDEKKNNKIKW